MPTLLLVEDSADDVLLMRRALRKAGVVGRVEVVTDGDAAVAYLEGSGPYADRARFPLPDAMFLDLKLPRRSGLEVLAWVRGQPAFRLLPVVILTSSREDADVRRAYERGASSYVTKPGAPAVFEQTVVALRNYWLELNVAPLSRTG